MSDSEVDQLVEDEVYVWQEELDAMRHDRDQKQLENDMLTIEKKKLVEAVSKGNERNMDLEQTIKVLNRRLRNVIELKYKLEEEFDQLWDRLQ